MMKVKDESDSARSSGIITAQNRFSFETELTFAPKLNATSIRLAKERQSKYNNFEHQQHQFVSPVSSVGNHATNSTSNREFSFKPRMSSTSLKIAENLGTTFMARQELHLERQRKLIEQSKLPVNFKARLSPVLLHRVRKLKEKENLDNSKQQLAWSTPNSSPNILDYGRKLTDLDGVKVGVIGSVSMHSNMLNPVRPSKHQLQRLNEGPYSSTGATSVMKKQKPVLPKTSPSGVHKRSTTHPPEENEPKSSPKEHIRSKTTSSPEMSPRRSKFNLKRLSNSNSLMFDKMQIAKMNAEKAIKLKKVFSIQGPYPVVRECLRNREWVEKQYRSMAPHTHKAKKMATSDYDSDDSDNDDDQDQDNGCHGDSDEEDGFPGDSDGLYGTMSRVVRNAAPNFMWTCRRDSIDFKLLRKDTIVNHFAKNGSFTTKVGLCTNLRNLHWFDNINPDEFFPRCYKVCSEEEKNAFIDDYRLTAAISILKWVVENCETNLDDTSLDENCQSNAATPCPPAPNDETKVSTSVQSPVKAKTKKTKKVLPPSLIEMSCKIVDMFLEEREHSDIDIPLDTPPLFTAQQWDDFIQQYYQLIFEGGSICKSATYVDYSQDLVNRLKPHLPQLDLDGVKNVWIIKPGAKSRGRGIMCMNRLEDIVKLVGNPMVQKEGKWVVQKYIERPLLVYNTKFDIRQWFLVTDWNALTIWFYKDCYLRFCTQPYTLDDFDTAIHLSNQSVQKHYSNNPTRSTELPDDNMWTSAQFCEYLEGRDCGNVWMDLVYPGMKRAIIDALLCAQDIVEPRKHSFEVYGADFMLTEDFKPWLIEINSSPAMGATTKITEQMCFDVIEDTMKIVLDRRQDKTCDTGHFELAYKQAQGAAPPYIGMNLSVEGATIKKPSYLTRQKSTPNMFGPRTMDTKLHAERTRLVNKAKSIKEGREAKGADGSKSNTSLEEVQKKLTEHLAATQHQLHIRRSKLHVQAAHTEIAIMTHAATL
ncbi:tubulin tyrosine ligase 3-like isoform X2 [Antedon mediterranea]|uniref:tubulin tyrosine ligase 3-like isoform X2 n=1 Tax=Antedon mediterranea TaxID=105859 RepID=UPI003AF912AA